MKIALCAPLMEADFWQQRIESVTEKEEIQIFEFNQSQELLAMPGLRHYDVVWMVAEGAKGMEEVRELKEKDQAISIVWVSNDIDFWPIGLQLPVTGFLPQDCTDMELKRVMNQCEAKR